MDRVEIPSVPTQEAPPGQSGDPASPTPEGQQSAEQFTEQVDQSVAPDRLDLHTGGDRPEWLPQKFDSPEAMAQAYSELEQRLGGAQAPQATQGQPEELSGYARQVGDALEAAAEEFSRTGTISDAKREALDKLGIRGQYQDMHLQGMQAYQQQHVNTVFDLAGGKDAFFGMQNWANTQLNDDEKVQFNEAINSGDSARAKLAIEGLKRLWETNGSPMEPVLIDGDPNSDRPDMAPFRSMHEMRAAMQDERYKSGDPAYHADFDSRLRRSGLVAE